MESLRIDSSRYIKVPMGETEPKAVGLSHGGLNTKIHAVVDGLGNPVELLLSPGNDHDSVHALEFAVGQCFGR